VGVTGDRRNGKPHGGTHERTKAVTNG
jgi:hypothetical protein